MIRGICFSLFAFALPALAGLSDEHTYNDGHGFSIRKPEHWVFIQRDSLAGNDATFIRTDGADDGRTSSATFARYIVAFGGTEPRPAGQQNPGMFVERLEEGSAPALDSPEDHLRVLLNMMVTGAQGFKIEESPREIQLAGAKAAYAEHSAEQKDGYNQVSRSYTFMWAIYYKGRLYRIAGTTPIAEKEQSREQFEKAIGSIQLE